MAQDRMSRRRFLSLAAGLGSTAVLGACTPKVVEVEKKVVETVEVPVESPAEVKTGAVVRFHENLRPADTAAAMAILDDFRAETGIEIKHEPLVDGWEEKVLAMMAAGTAPDVQIGYGDPMYAFVSRGMFVDVQPMVDQDLTQEQIDDFVKPQWDFFEFGELGKRFAMPKYCGTSGYLYNKSIFDEAGIAHPDNTWDWTTGVEIGKRMTEIAEDGRYEKIGWDIADLKHLGYVLAPFIWTWGGEVHDPDDNGICTMDGPKSLEALQFAQDLRFKYQVTGLPSDYDALATVGWGLFCTGRVAMHRGGSWHIGMALNNCDFAFDCMENPYAPGTTNRATFLTTDGWGIWVGSKVIPEAWEFLKMLSVSGIWGEYLINGSWPTQPCKRSLADKWVERLKTGWPRLRDADIEAFVRAYDYARPQVTFCDNPVALELINPVLDQIYMLGTVQATEAIPPLVEEVNAALKQACPEGGWSYY